MTNQKISDIFIASGIAASALLIEHVALWNKPQRIDHPVISYAVGVATLNSAVTWYLLKHRQYDALASLWSVTGIGGATVATCYYARHVVEKIYQQSYEAGALARWIDDTIKER